MTFLQGVPKKLHHQKKIPFVKKITEPKLNYIILWEQFLCTEMCLSKWTKYSQSIIQLILGSVNLLTTGICFLMMQFFRDTLQLSSVFATKQLLSVFATEQLSSVFTTEQLTSMFAVINTICEKTVVIIVHFRAVLISMPQTSYHQC